MHLLSDSRFSRINFSAIVPSQMVYCQICCEAFHNFCLSAEERPLGENKENWCCRRCKFCHVCGRRSKLSKVPKPTRVWLAPCLATCVFYKFCLPLSTK